MTDLDVKTLFNPQKSEEETTNEIIDNILIMLHNRLYFTKDKQFNLIETADRKTLEKSGLLIDKTNYTFVVKTTNNLNYVFKIIYQKITAVGKSSIISDFLKDYAKHKKILVATDFNSKIIKYVATNRAQIFKTSSFNSDIAVHRDQPIFQVLSPKEKEQVKLEYNLTEYTTKKFVKNDPMVKYYDLKKKDMVRIIRYSIISGQGIDYRCVL